MPGSSTMSCRSCQRMSTSGSPAMDPRARRSKRGGPPWPWRPGPAAGTLSDEQVANLYRGADLFVMPNIAVEGDIEGFGVVLLEAGLNGMTSIAARLEGIEDAVTHGANGFLVESRDAQGFAAEIVRLDRDRDRLFALGQAASQFTRQRLLERDRGALCRGAAGGGEHFVIIAPRVSIARRQL